MRKALFISILWHMVIAGMVTFTLTMQSAPLRPTFIFLGSILPPQEFSRLTTGLQNEPLQARKRDTGFPIKSPQRSPKIIQQKPLFQEALKPAPKYSYKSPIEEFNLRQNEEETPLEKLGITSTVPARTPLRLHP